MKARPESPAIEPHFPELTVIMPAYNEGALIEPVVRLWVEELDRLGIDYVIAVYNDGSRDATGEVLSRIASQAPRVIARTHSNIGHGPTILRGYADARGKWVFQVDSDHEIWPTDFEQLWRERDRYDLLIGRRTNRGAPMIRRVVSWSARAAVSVLFGSRVRDVNAPFRLIRRESLHRLLPSIPANAFAPNVIMSGLASRQGLRTGEFPVHYHNRSAGETSLSSAGALAKGWRCLRETAGVAFRRR